MPIYNAEHILEEREDRKRGRNFRVRGRGIAERIPEDREIENYQLIHAFEQNSRHKCASHFENTQDIAERRVMEVRRREETGQELLKSY